MTPPKICGICAKRNYYLWHMCPCTWRGGEEEQEIDSWPPYNAYQCAASITNKSIIGAGPPVHVYIKVVNACINLTPQRES